ncbi:putative signal peptide protein [Halorubrum sp. AJ67]|nr:putative signal peptide protein [Halorubrum sp. AJ67]
MNRRLIGIAGVLACVVLVGVAVAATNPTLLIAGYDTATVGPSTATPASRSRPPTPASPTAS